MIKMFIKGFKEGFSSVPLLIFLLINFLSLSIVYFLIVFPINFISKIVKKQFFDTAKDKDSYWKKFEDEKQSEDYYYKQY